MPAHDRARRFLVAWLLLAACKREPARSGQDAYRQPERLVAALGLRPGMQVAEVGAGGGYLTGRLARAVAPGGRVVATDIDEGALAALGARLAAEGVAHLVEVRRVEKSAPGLEERAFDLVLLAQVDHLLARRELYLNRLRPSLRPGGAIAVSNSLRFREEVLFEAGQAGYAARDAPAGLPGQFLLFLTPIQEDAR